MTIFFFGGANFMGFCGPWIFMIKTVILVCMVFLVRGMVPRYRYDQLMIIGWRYFLPVALGFVVFYSSIAFFVNLYV